MVGYEPLSFCKSFVDCNFAECTVIRSSTERVERVCANGATVVDYRAAGAAGHRVAYAKHATISDDYSAAGNLFVCQDDAAERAIRNTAGRLTALSNVSRESRYSEAHG